MSSKRGLEGLVQKPPADRKTQKSRVVVGEAWPEEIEVEIHHPPSVDEQRTNLGIGLTKLFGTLLVLLTFYSMFSANQELLSPIFRLVQQGIIFALGWAWGVSPNGQSRQGRK